MTQETGTPIMHLCNSIINKDMDINTGCPSLYKPDPVVPMDNILMIQMATTSIMIEAAVTYLLKTLSTKMVVTAATVAAPVLVQE